MQFRFVSTHKVLFQVPENQHTFTEKFPWYGAKVVGLKCHSSRVFKSPLEKNAVECNTGSRVQCESEAQRY